VRFKETNESEPLMTCRNSSDEAKTGAEDNTGIRLGGNLLTAQLASGMEAA